MKHLKLRYAWSGNTQIKYIESRQATGETIFELPQLFQRRTTRRFCPQKSNPSSAGQLRWTPRTFALREVTMRKLLHLKAYSQTEERVRAESSKSPGGYLPEWSKTTSWRRSLL